MKKKIVIFVTAVFLFTSSFPLLVSAAPLNYDQNKVNTLVSYGLAQKEAENLSRLDAIRKAMEQNGQKIDLIDNEVKIISPKDIKNGISKDDEDFITRLVKDKIKKPRVSREKKISDLNDEFIKNPGRSKYRLTFDDGSWIQAEAVTERTDEIKDDRVRTFGNAAYPNETQVSSKLYSSSGIFAHTYTLIEVNSTHYTNIYVSVNYTVVGDYTHTYINYYSGGQSAGGLININNSQTQCTVQDTSYYGDPTTWCETFNRVAFTCSSSVGFTLSGALSIAVSPGMSWTEWAITRESLVYQYDYAAYN